MAKMSAKRKRQLMLIAVSSMVLLLSGCSVADIFNRSGNDTASSAQASIDTETDENQISDEQEEGGSSEYYFRDGVYYSQTSKIVITDWKVYAPGEGLNKNQDNSIIVFWYDVTSFLEIEVLTAATHFSAAFNVIQDDPNVIRELFAVFDPDPNLSNGWDPIKQNGTVSYAQGYVLEDNFSDVILEPWGEAGVDPSETMTFEISASSES